MPGSTVDRIKMGLAAGLLAAATGLAAAPAAADFDRVRWPVPMAFASNLTALGDAMPWVAEQLKAQSGGKVDLRVFEPGKMIPALGVFDAVSEGKVEAGYTWMGYEIGKVPASALFGAVPFGLEPWEFAAWFYFGGGKQLLEEVYKPHNVHPIFCGTISPEASGWFRFEITSLDQVKGLKFRAAGLGGKIWQKLGASVTLLPGGELFQALEKGVLDGTEFSLPTVDEQLGFYKVAKFYYLPGWHQPSTSQYLYVNKKAWDSINKETQALIETTCTAAVTMAIAKAEALQGPMLSKFEKEGVKLVRWSEEMLAAFKKATEEVMAEEAAKDPLFKKVYESQTAFQSAHAPWRRYGFLPRS
ncbi:MAG: TRAP transporter substrate-binding protein [Geminicoccaceae bacterium]|nr:TRAP transporter substrate-binding protein [Geminicoccaceae bacterium]MCX8102430.1 TRAP transporter substrate-binding protein [Geminicoccaceae bacterium]